ncbi:MAG: DegT/DnrJ/EryC1/StrS family aminotransferase, partial [Planctomycetes bacterium]|nr:DegT/DnrJ/EryC1/StrS family aminotransferase [Planctomycetota bacterium]
MTVEHPDLAVVPFHRITVTEAMRVAVQSVIESGWWTTGPVAREFEDRFARAVGAPHAVAVSSGTAALELALCALDVGEGDSVITTPYTFAATAEVVVRRGARVRFADIEPDTLQLSVSATRSRLLELRRAGERVRAIVVVHFGGAPADLGGFDALAREFEVAIVEDAAHAFPTRYAGTRIGTPRESAASPSLACFSFYANKTLCTGEGGMLTTDDAGIARRVRRLALHGIDRTPWDRGGRPYEVLEVGTKANLPDLLACLGLVGLDLAEKELSVRRRIADRYHRAFRGLVDLELPAADDRS